MELKKPTTFAEQIALLQKKGIVINDVKGCSQFLSQVNYYRLSGYLLPFTKKKTCNDTLGTNFTQIEAIYKFDSELRTLISAAVEKIEIYLKTQISYYHAHKYGAEGYLTASSFHPRHNHNAFLKHVSSCISENASTLVIRHHQKYYGGIFPLWVIIDYFSLGMLSHFFRDMKNQDKTYLSIHSYGVNYQTLDSWLRCLTDLRNRCAHYSRLYYWTFSALPKMPPSAHYVPTRRLFAQLYMLSLLYPTPDCWNEDFLIPLVQLIQKYQSSISLKHLDFPQNWRSLLTR